ncbi:unnamed protein product [Alopecurus aequalis]
MKFACFGGVAAVADETMAVARRHRRAKLFFGNKAEKSPSRSKSKASSPVTITKRITSPGRRETDLDLYMIAAGKSSSSSSVPSLSALSTAASLDSACSSSSSSSCFSSRSSSYSSLSVLEAMPPQPARKRVQPDEQNRSPAAGAAAVLVCLVMMTFGGRLAATLLTAALLCFFPRRWPARATAADSLPRAEHVVASRREAEAINTRAVTDGFLVRNRKKF